MLQKKPQTSMSCSCLKNLYEGEKDWWNGVEYALLCQHYEAGGNKKLLYKQKPYFSAVGDE